VNANTATEAQIQAAIEKAGLSSTDAAKWAALVISDRPYTTTDTQMTKLRTDLTNDKVSASDIAKIMAVLQP